MGYLPSQNSCRFNKLVRILAKPNVLKGQGHQLSYQFITTVRRIFPHRQNGGQHIHFYMPIEIHKHTCIQRKYEAYNRRSINAQNNYIGAIALTSTVGREDIENSRDILQRDKR